ncbi:hypothetical protein H4R35_002686 [Dimargaris xerosporica]|nr:hypothetical protein H4R35_002686 [Dimargaris xerosporica]
MSSSGSKKALVVGAVNGQFTKFFRKIAAVHQRNGPFDMLLCTGSFFYPTDAESDGDGLDDHTSRNAYYDQQLTALLNGQLQVPLPTYFILGHDRIPLALAGKVTAAQGGEVCPNVICLGKSGVYKTAEGIKLAYLGGTYTPERLEPIVQHDDPTTMATDNDASDAVEPLPGNQYTNATVQAFITSHNAPNFFTTAGAKNGIGAAINQPADVDILLTFDWPRLVTRHSNITVAVHDDATRGHAGIAQTVMAFCPRYHFAGAAQKVFYEREPFKYPDNRVKTSDGSPQFTRFIGLAAFNNPDKQKWLYAMQLTPLSGLPPVSSTTPSSVDTPACTPCPFPLSLVYDSDQISSLKRQRYDSDPNEQYRWNLDRTMRQTGNKRPHHDSSIPPEGYVCRRCQVPGHWIQDCPQHLAPDAMGPAGAGRQAGPPNTYVCKICQTPGHWIQDCPQKQQQQQQRDQPPPGYLCKICQTPGHWIRDCPQKTAGSENRSNHPGGQCWFCLANPNVDKQLIVSICREIYLTVAKGGLPDKSPIPGGGHFIILPIEHYSSFRTIPMDTQLNVVQELDQCCQQLRQLCEAHGHALVVFELARPASPQHHAHLQAVAVPKAITATLKARFLEEARGLGISEFQDDFPDDPTQGYFKIDLPDGSALVHPIHHRQGQPPFDMQFGRRVLAAILGCPSRVNWRSCIASPDEEKQLAEAAAKAIKELA